MQQQVRTVLSSWLALTGWHPEQLFVSDQIWPVSGAGKSLLQMKTSFKIPVLD